MRLRTPLALLCAALLLGALPLLAPAQAREGRLADAILVERDDAARLEFRGQSRIMLTGACLTPIARCVGNDTEDGSFFLPTHGHAGRVFVWWHAADESLRTLRVRIGAVELEGESPLEFDLPGAEAGEYFVRPSTARMVLGSHDQPIHWTASFDVDAPARELHGRGSSSYWTATGCAGAICDALLRHRSNVIVLPWTAEGEVVATWDDAREIRRLSVPGTGFVAEGTSPLTMRLDGLAAGRWEIHFDPTTPVLPGSEERAEWTIRLTPQ